MALQPRAFLALMLARVTLLLPSTFTVSSFPALTSWLTLALLMPSIRAAKGIGYVRCPPLASVPSR